MAATAAESNKRADRRTEYVIVFPQHLELLGLATEHV
jgi:hypothetical protein